MAGKLKVTPVFARLREHLKQYVPEKLQAHLWHPPDTHIRGLAQAKARAATCISQSNFSKFLSRDGLSAQILCFALAGQMGRKGAGYMGFLSFGGRGGRTVAGQGPPRSRSRPWVCPWRRIS